VPKAQGEQMKKQILLFTLLLLAVTAFAQLAFTPDQLDFGDVTITESITLQLIINNNGTELINVTNITSNLGVITVNMTTFPVYAGATMPLQITYAPTPQEGEGEIDGMLSFTTDEPANYECVVTGNAVAEPVLYIDVNSLQFDVFVGEDTLQTQAITITNTGFGTATLNFAITPTAPLLVSPQNEADLEEYPTLQWATLPTATAYTVQVATEAEFTDLLIDEVLTANSYTIENLEDGVYYWRVKAQNEAGWGIFSEVWNFAYINPWQCGDVVTDIDGNVYQTIMIGDQCWMAENLKVTHYRNGDAIPTGLSSSSWSSTTSGAYAVYDNNQSYADTYGYLYNWYAVDDERGIAPEGWHIASDEEWMELEMALGMSESEATDTGFRGTDQGSQLAGNSSLWNNGDLGNNAAFGTSGFNGLPGGYRSSNGNYDNVSNYSCFWSSTVYSDASAWDRRLNYYSSDVYRSNYTKSYGFSLRCVRD
jgi:uncharacterized protein (TIGR02145 family)